MKAFLIGLVHISASSTVRVRTLASQTPFSSRRPVLAANCTPNANQYRRNHGRGQQANDAHHGQTKPKCITGFSWK